MIPKVHRAWVAGESALATGVRRHLVRDRGRATGGTAGPPG
jgi:NADPH-dependent ferric siderophore reductase